MSSSMTQVQGLNWHSLAAVLRSGGCSLPVPRMRLEAIGRSPSRVLWLRRHSKDCVPQIK